jgi:hypothetical protein
MFNKIYIIHRASDLERNIEPLIESLKGKYKTLEIIEPEPRVEDYSSLICFWSKKVESRKGVISLYNTNISLMEQIVDQQLDKVLILEDDAELYDSEIILNNECDIHFLNTRMWKKKNASCMANYYPNWLQTRRVLRILKMYRMLKNNKHRPIDLELDYCKNKFLLEFEYSNYFIHPKNESTIGSIHNFNDDGTFKTNIN